MILRTQSVSYPRSGHGALYNTLWWYFGDRLVYCDAQKSRGEHCGCGNVPCANPETNFSKNHDFGLVKGDGLEILPGQRYLVQYRSPVRSIASNYPLFLERWQLSDAEKIWRKFARAEIGFWNRLIDKWVLDLQDRGATVLACSYERLVDDSAGMLADVIRFMTDKRPGRWRMRRALSQVKIRPLDRLAGFRHYDREFFWELEQLAGKRMQRLGLPSFDEGV